MRSALVLALLIAAPPARADRLSPADLARKNAGGYFTGLPLFVFTTDIGFGTGARAYYFWNGDRDDARFSTTPYLHRIFLQGFASTRGIQYHWLDYDAPRIASSPYRIRAQLVFGRNISSNYFGHGNAALQPLQFPGSGTFDNFADYTTAQQQVAGGLTYAKYDQFDLIKPLAIASVERLFAGDRVRVLAGLGQSYAWVNDYTGEQVDALDADGNRATATQAPTRVREDCDAGKLVGCEGGHEGWLRLGLSYDTRDFEPDPNRGVFLDVALDAATIALGSEYDYVRVLGAARGYWSPIAEHADVVLAGRAFLELQTAGTPFHSLDALPFTEDFHLGLGGHRTLRGYRQDRFVGRAMAAVTGEVRWTFWRFTLLRQKLALIAVPFVDAGRSFDRPGKLTLSDWRGGYGGALRVSWNLATIITVDYGRSAEDAGFYVNFGHMF
ncbi:MAG: BamA/TamA family outer membrane protein [Deltaproteobacteria bacterium]|nr:BamA/TamA family outer membrane protein [Deltaproteobacteria bacterium]